MGADEKLTGLEGVDTLSLHSPNFFLQFREKLRKFADHFGVKR
jgi:hypothetical protein